MNAILLLPIACATCNVDPNSPLAHAADASVLLLLGIVLTILGSFVAFFYRLWLLSKNPLPDHSALLDEDAALNDQA